MSKTRKEREQIIIEAKKLSNSMQDEAKFKAKEMADLIIQDAKKVIETEKQNALKDVKNTVANLSLEIAEKILKKELLWTFIPFSPRAVSIIIAAVLFVIDFFNDFRLPNSKWSNPATFGPNPSVIFFDPLAKIAAIVLPWNEFFTQRTLFFVGLPIE